MDVKCPGCFNITTVFSHAQVSIEQTQQADRQRGAGVGGVGWNGRVLLRSLLPLFVCFRLTLMHDSTHTTPTTTAIDDGQTLSPTDPHA